MYKVIKGLLFTAHYVNNVLTCVRDNLTGRFVKLSNYLQVTELLSDHLSDHLILVKNELAQLKACLALHTDCKIINVILDDIRLCNDILNTPKNYYVKNVMGSKLLRIIHRSFPDDVLYINK